MGEALLNNLLFVLPAVSSTRPLNQKPHAIRPVIGAARGPRLPAAAGPSPPQRPAQKSGALGAARPCLPSAAASAPARARGHCQRPRAGGEGPAGRGIVLPTQQKTRCQRGQTMRPMQSEPLPNVPNFAASQRALQGLGTGDDIHSNFAPVVLAQGAVTNRCNTCFEAAVPAQGDGKRR